MYLCKKCGYAMAYHDIRFHFQLSPSHFVLPYESYKSIFCNGSCYYSGFALIGPAFQYTVTSAGKML